MSRSDEYLILLFIGLLIILLFGKCSSYGQEYLTITTTGDYQVLQDYYNPTEFENRQLDNYVSRWCRNNNPSNQTNIFYRIRNLISRVTTYDNDALYCYSAWGTLFNGRGVCMGYALLAKKFFDAKGIENDLIYNLEINHLYNRVVLDGNVRDVDITWYDYELERLNKFKTE